MTTSNIIPRVTCFDIRAALSASPSGTRVCIDFSTLIGRLIFNSTGNDCKCEIARFPIPTSETSFDNEYVCRNPVLSLVSYRLKNFSSNISVDAQKNYTTCTFRCVKHVDSLTLQELLREHPSRIQFEADCISSTFTVCVSHNNNDVLDINDHRSSSPLVALNPDPNSVRQLYEVTKRYLRRKRRKKSIIKNRPLTSTLTKCKQNITDGT